MGDFPLNEGGSVSFTALHLGFAHGLIFDAAALVSLAGLALAVGIVSVVIVRALTRPLRTLARAADQIGSGSVPIHVPEEGSVEVREAARAFNAMQERIQQLQADRVEALAAVGHDLRTPLARLRLRTGFLDDAEVRERMDSDLDDMERMVEGVLGYLREGRDDEVPRSTDLVEMMRTLCHAAADLGATVEIEAPDRLVLTVKQTAVRRALGNLVENGASHGGGLLSVAVRPAGGGAVVEIADRGPGIQKADLGRVLEPFVRLDASRSRSTGGVGLGLAIARRAIEAAGGALRLTNRPGGGLMATVTLPPIPVSGAPRGAQRPKPRRFVATGSAPSDPDRRPEVRSWWRRSDRTSLHAILRWRG